jgi:hypothetical protein
MLLMPIAGVEKSYDKLEGERVEATGVLVGLVSAGEVHVLCVVRELTALPTAPE